MAVVEVNGDAVGEVRRGGRKGVGRDLAGRERKTRNRTEEFD